MIEKMWEILSKQNEAAQQDVLSKCEGFGFDPNRGVVSLDQSFINLNLACEILRDAIQRKKLIQLPITIQKTFISCLEDATKYQDNIINGTDDVANLADAIEKLNTYIWQYGLYKLSEEILGYQTKMNQLKNMLVEAAKVKKELKTGLNVKGVLEQILDDAENKKNLLQKHVEDSEAAEAKAKVAVEGISAEKNNASVLMDIVRDNHNTVAALLFTSRETQQEIAVMETSVKAHLEVFNTASVELEKHKTEQQELFNKFRSYRDTINSLLEDANRAGMASSFERRKTELATPMYVWLVVFAISLGGLVAMGVNYLAPLFDSGNLAQLPFRIVLTAPLVWLGWFAAKQYSYTSRLREDYAYKAASAMSFEGYKREATAVNPDMLKNLLETAIKNLGENPIRIYNGRGNHASPLHEILESLSKDGKVSDLLKMLKKE